MSNVPKIDEQIIEHASKIIAEACTGSKISDAFASLGLIDQSGESTKWRRINCVLCNAQRKDGNATKFILFIQKILAPVRFIDKHSNLKILIEELNKVLIFAGIKYEENGTFKFIKQAESLSEAEKRASSIRQKLVSHGVHPKVLDYCTAELMGNDAFHGVLEACKGLFAHIRELTGLTSDGSQLIDEAFGGTEPLLALNSLRTQTEQNEQKGLINLLRGCTSAFRNTTAHEPRILWSGTDNDALDSLIFISMLHKKIDKCVRTNFK